MADVEIKGLSELLAAMRQLPKEIEQKCLRASVAPGAQLIRNTAQEIVTRKTGLVAKAVRIGFNKKESTPGRVVYHVFVSMNVRAVGEMISGSRAATRRFRAAGNTGKMLTPYYWRFLEFGTSKMSAKPFMRPAFDVSSQQALSIITNKLADRIEKEAARLGKR
jgi:HK97 gp10 family phage protein